VGHYDEEGGREALRVEQRCKVFMTWVWGDVEERVRKCKKKSLTAEDEDDMPRSMRVGDGAIEPLRIYNNGSSCTQSKSREWVVRKFRPEEIRVPFGMGGGILERERSRMIADGR
jgi:hypothetical protein